MSRTPAAFPLGPLTLSLVIGLAALSRLLPHPPNFSPVAAIALFGGAYFASRRWAVAAPLLAMLLSDLLLAALNGGLYREHFASLAYWAVYACILLSSVLGFGLRGRVGGARVLGYSLTGSAVFFVLTNLALWAAANPVGDHPACEAGLLPCYAAALPFFKWTLLGTLFYSALLFGGYEMLHQRVPALRLQTA